MKKQLGTALLALVVGALSAQAQGVTQKEAVKTTKIAQKNAKQMQVSAQKSGSQSQKAMADKTADAAKRAEKQAKKNN